MHIDAIPVAIADPMPPAPSGSPTTGGRPSFGQFLDNAGAAANDRSPATTQPTSGQTASANQTAQNASGGGSNDGGKGGASATNPTSSSTSDGAPSGQPAPAAAQSANGQPASQSKSSALAPSFADNGRGNKKADNDAPVKGDSTAGTAAPTLLALVPVPSPIMPSGVGAAVSATTILSKAGSAAPAAGAANAAFPSGQASALGTGDSSKNGKVPATAAGALARFSLPGASDPIAAGPLSGLAAAAKSAAADLAVPTAAGPLTAPPSNVTTSGTAAATGGAHGGKTPISAQAAALLGRVSVMGAAHAPGTPAAGTAIPAAGAQTTGAAANGTAEAPVAPPAAPTAGAATSNAPAAGNGTVVVQATPLPPVSGTIDLTAKLSAAAIPPHVDAAGANVAKAKTDPHAATAAEETGSGKAAVAAAADAAASTPAKPTATSLLGGTSSAPGGPSEDDGTSGHAVDAAASVPQMRNDIAAAASGAPPMAPARETSVTPMAALHSVVDQVAIELKRGVKAGNDQIQINLEPASLGKIAVRLDFAQDGRVSATFSADRPDTLNLLSNDSRSLEQSLRDAGLRADSGSLSFNLSAGDNGASARQFAQSASYAAQAASMDDGNPLLPLSAAPVASTGLSHDGTLDIHV